MAARFPTWRLARVPIWRPRLPHGGQGRTHPEPIYLLPVCLPFYPIYLSIYGPIYLLPVYLPNLSTYPPIYLSTDTYLPIYPRYLSTYSPTYLLPIDLPTLSTYLPIYLCTLYLSTYLGYLPIYL